MLTVLDGAVLVVSAVEGVQPQTRVLMRTLRRLRIPTLVFVNKIDRRGARPAEVLDDLRSKLGVPAPALGTVRRAGRKDAVFVPLADTDTDGARRDGRGARRCRRGVPGRLPRATGPP